jgi:G patch domain-containing protein 1
MDDEDLRDVEEARKLETSQNYSGIGGPEDTLGQPRSLTDLLVPSMEETIGTTLLKKMGWKKGQGIGPRTLRKARDFEGESLDNSSAERYLFAPDNSRLVSFKRKDTPQGLGYIGELSVKIGDQTNERTNNDEIFPSSRSLPKPKKSTGHAFGVGVLNDDGDDEDPYEIRPKHLYNRVIGGDRPKKPVVVRPQKGRHVFIPQKAAAAQASFNMRKCHDGRLPLPGFILSDVGVQTTPDVLYPPPQVPSDWKPTLESSPAADAPSWANDTITKLDPRARGDILGETPLPGKSVFDFLTSDARNRIAQMTGKQNLPPGLGETAVSTNRSTIADIVPALDTGVAMTALKSGYMPYGDDQEKQSRYRLFLEIKARLREGLPDRVRIPHSPCWDAIGGYVRCLQLLIEIWNEHSRLGERNERICWRSTYF